MKTSSQQVFLWFLLVYQTTRDLRLNTSITIQIYSFCSSSISAYVKHVYIYGSPFLFIFSRHLVVNGFLVGLYYDNQKVITGYTSTTWCFDRMVNQAGKEDEEDTGQQEVS